MNGLCRTAPPNYSSISNNQYRWRFTISIRLGKGPNSGAFAITGSQGGEDDSDNGEEVWRVLYVVLEMYLLGSIS